MHFQNLMEIKFCWRQIFENLIIHESSVGSRDVTQHLVPISSAVLTFIMDTNKGLLNKTPPLCSSQTLLWWLLYDLERKDIFRLNLIKKPNDFLLIRKIKLKIKFLRKISCKECVAMMKKLKCSKIILNIYAK